MDSGGAQYEEKFGELVEQLERLQASQEALVSLIGAQAKHVGLPQLLSLKEAAFQLGTSDSGLQRLRRDGRILAVMLSTGKPMIPLSEITRLATPHYEAKASSAKATRRASGDAKTEAEKIRALLKRKTR